MDFFCFKQKTAYEMRISDWSAEVCSSDLLLARPVFGHDGRIGGQHLVDHGADGAGVADLLQAPRLDDGVGPAAVLAGPHGREHVARDRKSVVKGKSVAVRVDLGGRRIIKNHNKKKTE